MAINSFKVSYDDFQLDQIIQPDEFDVNFADLEVRMNQIIDVLNQLTDGIGGSGASIIHIEEVLPFLSQNLQGFLQELVTTLHEGGTGADFISSAPISGVTGATVGEQLVSLTTLLQEVQTNLADEVARLSGLTSTNADNITALDTRTTALEADIVSKVSLADVYTKTESDTNEQDLEDSIYANVYTKTEVDETVTKKTGDHEGTWQGLNIEDIAGAIHAKDLAISNTQPVGQEGLLWFNPVDNTYTIFLNGQWRATGRLVRYEQVLNRVTLGADSDTVTIGIPGFDPSIDLLTVHVNSTYMAKGFDYTINGDGTITFGGLLTAGSVIDFEASIVTAN